MSGIDARSDAAGSRRTSRWPAAVGVMVLLGAVALSVRAHYAVGPSGAPNQGPGAAVLGSVVQMLLVVCVAAFELALVVALVYAPWKRLREAGRSGRPVPPVSRRSLLRMAVAPAAVVAVQVALVVLLVGRRRRLGSLIRPGGGLRNSLGGHAATTVGSVTVWQATALAGAVGLVVLLFMIRARTRSRPGLGSAAVEPDLLAQDLSAALDRGLDDLAGGADPRTAVINAYERMERVLAGAGLAVRTFETPLEYLERALTRLRASRSALIRLTDLFETARFSPHSVDLGMRTEAESALAVLRSELSG